MPDITMCDDESCPKRYSCYRYMAIPSEYQSWILWPTSPETLRDKCELYWPINLVDGRKLRVKDNASNH